MKERERKTKKLLVGFLVLCCALNVARAANNCTGATYYDADSDTCIACPTGYDHNTTPGKTDITQCQIHCDAGTYVGGYTQLEYIESSGTQYIDTEYIYTNNASAHIIIDTEFTNLSGWNMHGLSGSVYGGPNIGVTNQNKLGGAANGDFATNITASLNTRYLFDLDVQNQNFTVTDVSTNTIVASKNDFSNNYNTSSRPSFMLFGYFSTNKKPTKNSSKVYNAKLYDNNVLVRDFIPVRRNSDGAIGMYDKVTNTFLGNAGTGTFIAGNDVGTISGQCTDVGAGYYAGASTVNFGSFGTRTACPAGTYSNNPNATSINDCAPCSGATYNDETAQAACKSCPTGYDHNTTPGKTDITQCQIHCDAGTWVSAEYTQLEYLESTGTQWIDTGIVNLKHNYRLQTGVEWIDTTQRQLVGVQGSYYVGCVDGYFQVTQGGSGHTALPASPNTRYDMDIKFDYTNKTAYGTINNVSYDFATNVGYSALNNTRFGVFSLNSAVFIFGRAKQYYYRLYDNDVLVRDMVPVRRNSDGVLGMYDIVSDQFFANAGTGTFIAGGDVWLISGQCTDVGAGYYAGASTVNFGSVGTRTECPAGTYSSITNAEVCTPCAGATYNDETAQAACKSCPTGYDHNTTPGKTDITQCQIHCDAGTWNGEYTQLEYIEATGTQYIDTGQNFMYGDEFFFEYMPIASYSNEDKGYGSGTPLDRDITGGGRRNKNDVVTMYMKNNNYAYSPTLSYTSTLGKKYTEHWKISTETGQLTSNLADEFGNTYVVTGATFADNYVSGRTVTLYRDNGSYEYPSRMRIYRTWLKRMDGTMAFDLVPVRRNSDGVLGMYDKVSGQFFTNAGTGTFIVGNDVSGQCIDVGAGYYAPEATFNYGSVGTRNACVAPTTTVGYGHGADEAADCGRVLHIDDKVIYARRNKITTPSLNIRMENGDMFYISLSPTNHSVSRLHMQQGETKYTAYDDSLMYGERDFDTGEQIPQ